jgi:hypothetical protein
MAQHDFNINNQSAPAFRGDLNNALEALVTLSSGATAPATTYAGMIWHDTAANTLYIRSDADDAWIALGALDQSANTFAPAGVAELTQVQAEDDTSTVFGQVSGQRLSQAVGAFQTDNGEIVASSGLTSSSGYVKFANGIIFQWVYSTSSSGTKSLSYPLAFPNRVWHVSMSNVVNTQNYQSAVHRTNWNTSLTAITVYNDGAPVEIFAVGY